MGISANYIQQQDIKSHTIIEPTVLDDLKKWSKKQKHKVNIVEGYWQDVLKNLETFDTIFIDDAPSVKYRDKENIRLYKFFYEILKKHVNKNSQIN